MRFFILYVFFFLPILALGEGVTDTIRIREVSVQSNKLGSEKAAFVFDSVRLANAEMQSLQKFLQENSSVQFKTYGTSGSAVMSIRGANSSHSKVLWNGLSLGSPMLNLNDVSLLSVNNADEISLQRGGSTASQGNGALAGFVEMKTLQHFDEEKISLSADFNSLMNQSYQLKYIKGFKNFSSQTAFQLLNHQNKFEYENYSELGKPIQEQINSLWNQFAITQSFFYRFKSSEIEWHQWYQESNRELSPPMFNRNRTNYQLDESYRSILKFKRNINENQVIKSSIVYTREVLRYVSRVKVNTSDLEIFNTRSYFDQVQQENTWAFNKNNFEQSFSSHLNFDGAFVEDYFQYRKRYRLAFSSLSKYNFNTVLNFQLANRIELLKGQEYFASSLTATFLKWKDRDFSSYLRISKNYNLPGLNDLYWVPGGNPDLVAEQSWEEELGFNFQKKINTISFKTNANIYHSLVNNWILWQPSALENGVWTPQNLVEVKLQGLEFDQEITWNISSIQNISIKFFYALTQAINQKAVNANDLSVGKQIIYIPEEKLGLNFLYQYKRYQLSSNLHKVSHRFTTADHSSFLPSYYLIDLRVQKTFMYKNQSFVTGFYIDNLSNQTYESLPFQAMPARVFGINIKYQFNR